MGFGNFTNQFLHLFKTFLLGFELVIGYAADLVVGGCTAQGFGIYVFAHSGFDQVRPGKENAAVAFHHKCFIAHDGKVGTTCHTGTHHSGYLHYAHSTHPCIVAEDAAKMFFVGKDFVLHRQEDSSTVHKVNNGEVVLHGYLLHPQVFLAGYWEPCTRLHGLVVGKNDTLPPTHITHTRHRTTRRTSALFGIHFIACEGTYFYKWFVFVKQIIQPFPWRQLVFFVLFVNGFFATSEFYFFISLVHAADGQLHGIFVFVEFDVHGVKISSPVQTGLKQDFSSPLPTGFGNNLQERAFAIQDT